MTKVHVPLSNDEYNLLHRISSSEFRLPEQMLRWLLHQEAVRRGLSSQGKGKSDGSVFADTIVAFAEVNP